MNEFSLVADQLTVNYDRKTVLWDISCAVPVNQIIGIIGPNGGGKTTLLKTSLGLIKPLSGKVQFYKKPIKKNLHRIAYIPQKDSIDWDFPISVFQMVLMGRYGRLGFFKRPRLADREATYEALELLGLKDFAHTQISKLSGGQQQRLFLARALVQDADIFLMDEPFSGIDVSTEHIIFDIFHRLKAEGKTIFVVHHDLASVERFFDYVIMLNTRLVASGYVADVFSQENVLRCFGKAFSLFNEASKLFMKKNDGLK